MDPNKASNTDNNMADPDNENTNTEQNEAEMETNNKDKEMDTETTKEQKGQKRKHDVERDNIDQDSQETPSEGESSHGSHDDNTSMTNNTESEEGEILSEETAQDQETVWTDSEPDTEPKPKPDKGKKGKKGNAKSKPKRKKGHGTTTESEKDTQDSDENEKRPKRAGLRNTARPDFKALHHGKTTKKSEEKDKSKKRESALRGESAPGGESAPRGENAPRKISSKEKKEKTDPPPKKRKLDSELQRKLDEKENEIREREKTCEAAWKERERTLRDQLKESNDKAKKEREKRKEAMEKTKETEETAKKERERKRELERELRDKERKTKDLRDELEKARKEKKDSERKARDNYEKMKEELNQEIEECRYDIRKLQEEVATLKSQLHKAEDLNEELLNKIERMSERTTENNDRRAEQMEEQHTSLLIADSNGRRIRKHLKGTTWRFAEDVYTIEDLRSLEAEDIKRHKKVYILLGTNNIKAARVDGMQKAEDLLEYATDLKQASGSEVTLLQIPPIARRGAKLERTLFNRTLKNKSKDSGEVQVIQVPDEIEEKDEDYLDDDLHLNQEAAKLYAAAIQKHSNKESSKITTRITFPSEKVGALVGRGGRRIRDLESNNRVQITIGKGDPCPLTITGEESNVKKVTEEIKGIKKELTTVPRETEEGREKSKIPCRFHLRGICNKGERCPYGHASQTRTRERSRSRTREESPERPRENIRLAQERKNSTEDTRIIRILKR